jgi:hypothetical protein
MLEGFRQLETFISVRYYKGDPVKSTIIGYFVEERADGTVVVEVPSAQQGEGTSRRYLDKEHIATRKPYEREQEWHLLWGFDYTSEQNKQ